MTESLGGKLHITSPDEPERGYPLDQPVVRIGRAPAPENDLALSHGWVSRTHARIFCDRLPYRIQDMRSSNGTSINDEPLPPGEVRPLKDGDVIAIATFRLRYEAPPEPKEAEPPPAKEEAVEKLQVRTKPRPKAAVPPTRPPSEEELAEPAGPERWVGMPERASRWLRYLPPIYGDDEFLGRFLLIFEDLLGPVQQMVNHFDLFLDPNTSPETFLPWLNDWLAQMVDEHWSPETQRELLRNASWLHQARGTKAGLMRHLEICTACEPEIVENADGPHTFRVTLHTGKKPVDQRIVERIIRFNCPAHARYTLEID